MYTLPGSLEDFIATLNELENEKPVLEDFIKACRIWEDVKCGTQIKTMAKQ